MSQKWIYYVPCVISQNGKVGFCARIVELPRALNSEETVWALIGTLTTEILGGAPEDAGELPLMPLSWTLISARQGESVKPENNGDHY